MGDQREAGVEGGGGKPNTPLGSWFGSQKRIYLEQKSRVYTPDYSPANLWKYYFGAAVAFGVLGFALFVQAWMVTELKGAGANILRGVAGAGVLAGFDKFQ